jgi:hypothetical protein
MMKKIIVSLIIMVCGNAAFCQYDTTPPYLKTKLLPGFNLLSLDSTVFDQSVLTEKNNTIIMLFNPECEHCQDQLKLMLDIPELVSSTNVILASTETLQKIKIFYDKFHLENYALIHIGKDHKYFFGGFYQPKTIPVLAFYNKQNELVYFNQGSVKKKQILDALKK